MGNLRALREQLRRGRSIYELELRVTFYARVSTDKAEQQGSLEHQIQYYTELIQKNPNWTYIPGYVDEGISGTSTYKRERFLQMIDDARRGLFDFIITKEISRFSRSTLDSIQYTQQLLDAHVGVLFQNDNINTLDTDSEFRLVVMAGVAQDEVRKLSERLKFGFRQSIKNGRVLGNNRMWGYDKQDCKLTVRPEQAQAVRLIFELYATGDYGIRKLSRELTRRGYTSLLGNDFNQLTIRHILTNPKYKGWYCGHKTQSLDYRTKKTALLDPEEWVLYPDPNIPAIVTEELWDRANAILRQRSIQAKTRGARSGGKYPYSGKIRCGRHGHSFHRQSIPTRDGPTESWRCKAYRSGGKAGCDLPALRTRDLDRALAQLFPTLVPHPEQLVGLVLSALQASCPAASLAGQAARLQAQIGQLADKKEKLLELSMAGAVTVAEFKQRNDRFNGQIAALQAQIAGLREEEAQRKRGFHPDALKQALWEEIQFTNGISSEVVSAILDHAVVLEGSTRRELLLELHLADGQTVRGSLTPKPFAFLTTCS